MQTNVFIFLFCLKWFESVQFSQASNVKKNSVNNSTP